MIKTEGEWVLRLVCAAIVGALIGYERHSQSKEAGIRTHAIVALSSAVFMLISKYGFSDTNPGDPARLAAQVVSGIGFLGAGIIFVRHNMIQGMATAAGIWATSAVGLAFGAGMYFVAALAGLLMIGIQVFFRKYFDSTIRITSMKLKLTMLPGGTSYEITEFLKTEGYVNTGNRISCCEDDGHWLLELEVYTIKSADPLEILQKLQALSHVEKARLG